MTQVFPDFQALKSALEEHAWERVSRILPLHQIQRAYDHIVQPLGLGSRVYERKRVRSNFSFASRVYVPYQPSQMTYSSSWEVVVMYCERFLFPKSKENPGFVEDFVDHFLRVHGRPEEGSYFWIVDPADPFFTKLQERMEESYIPLEGDIFQELRSSSESAREYLLNQKDPKLQSYTAHIWIWFQFLFYLSLKRRRPILFSRKKATWTIGEFKRYLSALRAFFQEGKTPTPFGQVYPPMDYPRSIIVPGAPVGIKASVISGSGMVVHWKDEDFLIPLPEGKYIRLRGEHDFCFLVPALEMSIVVL